jgi:hypothetical protein
MSYSLIDLSENAQDKRYPVTNDFGLLYKPSGENNPTENLAREATEDVENQISDTFK